MTLLDISYGQQERITIRNTEPPDPALCCHAIKATKALTTTLSTQAKGANGIHVDRLRRSIRLWPLPLRRPQRLAPAGLLDGEYSKAYNDLTI